LKALALGLELREVDGRWAFYGPHQAPALSQVAPEVMTRLLEAGYVRKAGGYGRLSDAGEAALKDALNSAIRLRSCAGRPIGRPDRFSEK